MVLEVVLVVGVEAGEEIVAGVGEGGVVMAEVEAGKVREGARGMTWTGR